MSTLKNSNKYHLNSCGLPWFRNSEWESASQVFKRDTSATCSVCLPHGHQVNTSLCANTGTSLSALVTKHAVLDTVVH